MNQKELIDAINKKGISKSIIRPVIEALALVVNTEMQKGEGAEVTLPGIGKISVKQSPARIGRNPATGAEISIPAKNKPHFSAAKALKEAAMSN
jgi:DNA-binding protein HU-beta